MMPKDEIYRAESAGDAPFAFNDAVADVFPDMLRRSIPGYAETIEAIGQLARRHVKPGTHCYDLGCSLAAATLAMRRSIVAPGCRIVAVDSSAAMIERCRQLVARDAHSNAVEIDIQHADIRDVEISRASLVVLNYTLQFLPVDDRLVLLQRIAAGMVDGGILVLSEKVADQDPQIEALLVELHHEFKRRNAYSELEISRKRTALENVLIPEPVDVHLDRLQQAGFRHAGPWLRFYNFVSILAAR
ncbi:MAG TPA: carboxy-S-adenosyl-L-methionine synthase CmoA [Woeseiaceae bacterium]|nr:carboxy-S-adenosyl-L-methionine synthase CmoA [Woeseiaceae bacterium]